MEVAQNDLPPMLQIRSGIDELEAQSMLLFNAPKTLYVLTVVFAVALTMAMPACATAAIAPVPAEIASTSFVVTINGLQSPVMHAARNTYFLNFDAHKRTRISITASTDNFWASGVEVQPWRLGIRPVRHGNTITFDLDGPAKISISRPGDYLGNAEMLYLFANPHKKNLPSANQLGLRYFGPGVHHLNIDAASGDRIYLAPGAVVFGSLNIWGVQHVKVFGTGVIVYDGEQNPADDDGWMHKPNWHCIVMDHATDIAIEGITCVVRSRTWQIQMKDSRRILFENIKVIGANAANANADGMDWLGGGDTIVRDSFIRAADDIFAMQSSWEGYNPTAFAVPGNPVTNITVENSVLSTSISNVVRAGWPHKNFQGGHFLMRNTDVLHAGMGGCGIPFALFEIWADPDGRGQSSDFRFENIRLEHWYSLTQLRQLSEGVRGANFTDVASLEQPSHVASVLAGNIHDVVLDGVQLVDKLAQKSTDIPIEQRNSADQPVFRATGPSVHVNYPSGLIKPGDKLRLKAIPDGSNVRALRYQWTFGDGTHATGRRVTHRFTDTEGTLLDGSGRFRVLLHVTDPVGRNDWVSTPIVVANTAKPARNAQSSAPGLIYQYYVHDVSQPTGTKNQSHMVAVGVSTAFDVSAIRTREQQYGITFAGLLDVPKTGGYNFTMLSNDAAKIVIDEDTKAVSPTPFAQVCGLAGNAVQTTTLSVVLKQGKHRIAVIETHSDGTDGFGLWWQGPGIPLAEVPATALSHEVDQP